MKMDIPHFEKHSYDHTRRPENLLFGTHKRRVIGPELELVRTTMPLPGKNSSTTPAFWGISIDMKGHETDVAPYPEFPYI